MYLEANKDEFKVENCSSTAPKNTYRQVRQWGRKDYTPKKKISQNILREIKHNLNSIHST